MEGLRDSVWRRLPTVCHLWPGITPFNVWDLPYSAWLMFAAHADAYEAEMREARRGSR